jgi:hypothetical protein
MSEGPGRYLIAFQRRPKSAEPLSPTDLRPDYVETDGEEELIPIGYLYFQFLMEDSFDKDPDDVNEQSATVYWYAFRECRNTIISPFV